MIDLLIATLNDADQIRYQKMGRNIAFAAFVIGGFIWAIVKANKSDK